MKTKRFLSLLLALAMSFALAVPAFAAEPGGGKEIMPLNAILLPYGHIESPETYTSRQFSTSPSNGNWIQYYFQNETGSPVTLMLYRLQGSTFTRVGDTVTIAANSRGTGRYYSSDAGSGTYYVRVECRNGIGVKGYLSVAQYETDPRV